MNGQDLRLDGGVALVTGANSPIGAAIAGRLADLGADLVLGVHHGIDRLETLAGTRVVADLADADGPERLVAAALDAAGRLDVLVHNAALQSVAPLADVAAADWDAVHDVNLRAAHLLARAAADALADAGGCIVNVATIEAHQPAPGHAHYAAAKAGLVMLTRAQALELGPRGVRANSVSPGLIDDGGLAERWPEGVERWLAAAPLGRLPAPTRAYPRLPAPTRAYPRLPAGEGADPVGDRRPIGHEVVPPPQLEALVGVGRRHRGPEQRPGAERGRPLPGPGGDHHLGPLAALKVVAQPDLLVGAVRVEQQQVGGRAGVVVVHLGPGESVQRREVACVAAARAPAGPRPHRRRDRR